jgi:MFS family permease
LLSGAVGVVAIVVSGVLADQIGRRTLLIGTAAAIAAFSGFAPQLLDGGDIGEATFMGLGFILLGLSFGQASGAVAANFSKTYRYTGSALTSDLAWLVGAAFAPLLALFLASHFGLMSCGGYLLSGAVITMAALGFNRPMEKRESASGPS